MFETISDRKLQESVYMNRIWTKRASINRTNRFVLVGERVVVVEAPLRDVGIVGHLLDGGVLKANDTDVTGDAREADSRNGRQLTANGLSTDGSAKGLSSKPDIFGRSG